MSNVSPLDGDDDSAETKFSLLGLLIAGGQVDNLSGHKMGSFPANGNFSLEEHGGYIFDHPHVLTALFILYTIVFIFCFFGNLAVLLVMTLHWKMRSITKFCLGNLAFANLCVALFCIYQNLFMYIIESWIFGDFLCKMYHFTNSLSHTASILILVVICVERYLVILYPFKCRRVLTMTRLKILIVGVWIISALLCSPRMFYIVTIRNPIISKEDSSILKNEVLCILLSKSYDFYTADLVQFILLFLLPLIIISILYTRIGLYLRRRTRCEFGNCLFSRHPSMDENSSADGTQIIGVPSIFEVTSNPCSSMESSKRRSCYDSNRRPKREKSSRERKGSDKPLQISPMDEDANNGSKKHASSSHHHGNNCPSTAYSIKGKGNSEDRKLSEPLTLKSLLIQSQEESSKRCNRYRPLEAQQAKKERKASEGTTTKVEIDPSTNLLRLSQISPFSCGCFSYCNKVGVTQRQHRTVVRMLITIVITFAVCNLPFHIRKIYQNNLPAFEIQGDFTELITPLTCLMMYVNCAINPILYGFMSKDFRTCLIELMHCKIVKPVNYRISPQTFLE